MEELFTIVAIDVADDRLRRSAVTMVLDYGLKREQYSIFSGPMTRNRREELYARIRIMLRERYEEDRSFGRVLVIPVGEREARSILRAMIGTPRDLAANAVGGAETPPPAATAAPNIRKPPLRKAPRRAASSDAPAKESKLDGKP